MTDPQSSAYGIGDPPIAGTETVPVAELRSFLTALFTAAGYRAEDAGMIAESLSDADARGIASHGSMRARVYIDRVRRGLVDATAVPAVSVRGATISVDGRNAPGHVAALAGMRAALHQARESGVAVAGVRASNHCGTLGYFLRRMAGEGLVGIAASNGPPVMAYFGGRTRAVGTNPFGFAVPRAGGPPVVLDMATSATARGKIIHAARTGSPIPPEWAVDPDGNPTTDPAAALAGAVVPFAGPKGSGLAMMVELLCGALLGGATGTGVGDMYEQWDRPQNVGHMFIALDPGSWLADGDLATRVAEFGARVHGLPTAAGHERVLLPGEVEERALANALRDGINLPTPVLTDLRALARELGLDRALTGTMHHERS